MDNSPAWSSPHRPGRHGFPPKVARFILRRAQYRCELGLPGCEGQATEADHTLGYEDAIAAGWDPEDIDDPANGQAVCRSCHAIKTTGEQARGRARAAQRKPRNRPTPPHPGLR